MAKLKSLLQVLALGLVLFGVPILLVKVAGNPLPTEVPDWGNLWRSLRQNDVRADLVISALAIIAWIVWAMIVYAVVFEIAVNVPAMLSGRELRNAPGVPKVIGTLVAHVVFTFVTLLTPMKTTAASTALPETVPVASVQQAESVSSLSQAEAEDIAVITQSPTWVVARGDTLWSIAEQTLGDGSRVDEIVTLNPGLPSARRLPIGTTLTLPEGATTPTVAPPTTIEEIEVEVVQGDNLWNLTEEHTGSVDMPTIHEIAEQNNIENPHLIYPGQTIEFEVEVEAPAAPATDVGAGDAAASEVAATNTAQGGDESLTPLPDESPELLSSLDPIVVDDQAQSGSPDLLGTLDTDVPANAESPDLLGTPEVEATSDDDAPEILGTLITDVPGTGGAEDAPGETETYPPARATAGTSELLSSLEPVAPSGDDAASPELLSSLEPAPSDVATNNPTSAISGSIGESAALPSPEPDVTQQAPIQPAPPGISGDENFAPPLPNPDPAENAAGLPSSDVSDSEERSRFPSPVWLFGSAVVGSLAVSRAWKVLAARRQRRRQWMGVNEPPVMPNGNQAETQRVLDRASAVGALGGGTSPSVRGLVVSDDEVEVLLREPIPVPRGWTPSHAGWVGAQPVPPAPVLSQAIATIGIDYSDGSEILIDLLNSREVTIVGDRQAGEALMCEMAFELAAGSDTRVVLAGLACRSAVEVTNDVEFVEVDQVAALFGAARSGARPIVVFVDAFAEGAVHHTETIRAAVGTNAALVWAGPLQEATEIIEVPSRQVMRWAGLEATPTFLGEDEDRQLAEMLASVEVGQRSGVVQSRPADPEAAAAIVREGNALDTGVGATITMVANDHPAELPAPPRVVIEPVEWPRVLLTACTEHVGAVGIGEVDNPVELSTVFLLHEAAQPLLVARVSEIIGCTAELLRELFGPEHSLVRLDNDVLSLRHGVQTDYSWPAECIRQFRAALGVNEGWHDWLYGTKEALAAVRFAPFSTLSMPRSSRSPWRWVDELPDGVVTRDAAEASIASAALGLADLYATVPGEAVVSRHEMVELLCQIAAVVPSAHLGQVGSATSTSGEALLVAAFATADGDVALQRRVQNTARTMVARQQIEASNTLGDQLALT